MKHCATCGDIKANECRKAKCVQARQPLMLTHATPTAVEAACMSNAGMLGVARCITGMSCPSRIGRAYGVICAGLKTEAAPYE